MFFASAQTHRRVAQIKSTTTPKQAGRVGTILIIVIKTECGHNSYEMSRKLPEMHASKSLYRGAGKSLDRPTSRCILFDG
jgi:hypothetical protein